MKKTITMLAILAFLSMSTGALAFTPVDVSEFDVAGVKLGMSINESIGALSKSLNIPTKFITLKKKKRISSRKGKYSQSAEYRSGDIYYNIHYRTNVYSKAPSMIVVSVSISHAINSNKVDLVKFYDAVISKYGKPSTNVKKRYAEYCKTNSCGAHNQSSLIYRRGTLRLADGAWFSKSKTVLKKVIKKVPVF